jgi:hypothetical protein
MIAALFAQEHVDAQQFFTQSIQATFMTTKNNFHSLNIS